MVLVVPSVVLAWPNLLFLENGEKLEKKDINAIQATEFLYVQTGKVISAGNKYSIVIRY